MKKKKSNVKVKPKPPSGKLVKKAAKKPNKKPTKKVGRSASRVTPLDLPAPTFPAPGLQNCFPDGATTLIATGTVPDSGTITQVQLYIGTNAAITITPTITGSTWTANFTTATAAALGNATCRLVVTGLDGTTRSVVAFEFSNQTQPAQLTLNGVPSSNHTTVVTGTTVDADTLTLKIDGTSTDPGFNSGAGTFSFTTPSTANSSQDLLFEATNASGDDALFDITLSVDQTGPSFENGPVVTPEDDSYLVTGEVSEADSGSSPGSGFNTDGSQFTVSITPPAGAATPSYTLTTTPISAFAFSYEVTVPTPTAAGQYTVNLTAYDVAGNQVSPNPQPTFTVNND